MAPRKISKNLFWVLLSPQPKSATIEISFVKWISNFHLEHPSVHYRLWGTGVSAWLFGFWVFAATHCQVNLSPRRETSKDDDGDKKNLFELTFRVSSSRCLNLFGVVWIGTTKSHWMKWRTPQIYLFERDFDCVCLIFWIYLGLRLWFCSLFKYFVIWFLSKVIMKLVNYDLGAGGGTGTCGPWSQLTSLLERFNLRYPFGYRASSNSVWHKWLFHNSLRSATMFDTFIQ